MTTHTPDLPDTPASPALPRKGHDLLILAGLLAFIFLPTLVAFALNLLAR